MLEGLGGFEQLLQGNRISEGKSRIRARHVAPGELLGGRYLRLCHIVCGRGLMNATGRPGWSNKEHARFSAR